MPWRVLDESYGLPLVALAFGLLVGSFLNVVVHRLPRGESVIRPRSRCPACRRTIAAWENVPLLSYLWLRGRCRGCGARISARYPAVEVFTGLLFAAIAFRYGPSAMTLVWLAFAAALVAAALIDFEHRIIPDEISLGGLLVGLLAVPAVRVLEGTTPQLAYGAAFAGALLGGGILWLVGFAHARVSVLLGRTFEHWPEPGASYPRPGELDYWTWFPGMGFGDVKLFAMIGAFLGPRGALETLIAASLAGLALGLVWIALRRRADVPFGFGPAIAAGALLVLLSPYRLFLI
ncbi:MAG: prepilin peptidase [Deltaproteobacteria bacterium]|nr:MAG: prepilin peptidase [Deltaproteobacteria bacterium]